VSASERSKATKAGPAKHRSRITFWTLIVNLVVLIIAVVASLGIVNLGHTPTPTPTPTHTPTPTPTPAPEISTPVVFFHALQAGPNVIEIQASVSDIPPGDTVWIVSRSATYLYYLPLAPITVEQQGSFVSSITLTPEQVFQLGNGPIFLYAVVCNPSANFILRVSPQGLDALPAGAFIVGVTQLELTQT
jgi:hypothetical protein